MLTTQQTTEPAPSPERLAAWVKAAYINALKRYGPEHPLTRSWLAELRDVELFIAHLPH